MWRSSKCALALSIVIVFATTPSAMAKWAYVSLAELLKETDLIVVARLANTHESTNRNVDRGSGDLMIYEVIQGAAKVGDKLKLEWSNPNGLVCPRVSHAGKEGRDLIWLLQFAKKGVFSANDPGRVLEVIERKKLESLLKPSFALQS